MTNEVNVHKSGEALSLEQIKEKELELLERFDAFCRENNLQYYLVFGSLLGAIRHNGFIPWDDDVDLCMPRKDYNRLIKLSKAWSEEFEFYCFEKSNDYVHYFGKITDKDTVVEYDHIYNNQNYGIYLDIFPLDYYPSSIDIDKIVKKLRYNIKMLKLCGMKKLWKAQNPIKNIIKSVAYSYAKIVGVKKWQTRINQLQCAYIGYKVDKTSVSIHGGTAMPASVFGEGDRKRFESIYINCPIQADIYLKTEFGNYMKLPPKSQRVSVHDFIVRWK